jgi:hypothetical protein
MDLMPLVTEYRRQPATDDKAKTLGVMAIRMDSAREVLDALRTRLAAVANGKRNG